MPTRCAPESRPQARAPSGAQVLQPTPSPQGACLCLTAGSALGLGWGVFTFPCRCLTSHPSATMHGRRLYPALHPAPCPGGQTQAGGPCPRGAPSQSPGPGIHACPSSLSAARRWPPARPSSREPWFSSCRDPGPRRSLSPRPFPGRDPAKPCPRGDPPQLGGKRRWLMAGGQGDSTVGPTGRGRGSGVPKAGLGSDSGRGADEMEGL